LQQVSPISRRRPRQRSKAFTLIEVVTVIAVLVILLMAGISLLGGTGAQARRAATDLLAGMIEQARTTAITTRSDVILAIAEPGDLPGSDERGRLALFRVETWPDSPTEPIKATLLNRWRTLETGVVLLGGEVGGLANPLDSAQRKIQFGPNHSKEVEAHILVFHPRGGLRIPEGSTPVAMRVAEGGYRNGVASPNRRGDSATIAENQLRIGRVTARAYRSDG
jgi:prepilin-type N-terminal cleavage/methylation domain-containing protein